ncbi:PREDICTED: A-kinase-interacting protein 1 [Nanorana parkeri]|uniref:A-kinase-interacting protein 1 n=1 Tax=Nanorana parkeri TaxID=125878 RepID=UPI0008543E17|nr:PREDICTED: A-kinase-interacting protein 1 [Nanorana parkeri]
MEGQYRWMEESLRRTSEQAREVLERARRREVDWWAGHRHEGVQTPPGTEDSEDDGSSVTLEEAFTTMSDFMRRTTEQCKAYHSCIPPRGINEQEKQHIGRFHRRRPPRAAQRLESRLVSSASSQSAHPLHSGMKKTDPRDVYIEVAPGTYSISAGSPDCPAKTRIVNITPGQSVDLTFHV